MFERGAGKEMKFKPLESDEYVEKILISKRDSEGRRGQIIKIINEAKYLYFLVVVELILF